MPAQRNAAWTFASREVYDGFMTVRDTRPGWRIIGQPSFHPSFIQFTVSDQLGNLWYAEYTRDGKVTVADAFGNPAIKSAHDGARAIVGSYMRQYAFGIDGA